MDYLLPIHCVKSTESDYSTEQCSIVTTGNTLPTFKPRPTSMLQCAAIDREKILSIIQALHSNKAHGCILLFGSERMLFLFIRRTADSSKRITALSLSCQFLEKVLKNSFMILFIVIYVIRHQSGFRPGDSTVNQLLAITHQIYSAFEATCTEETRAVFLNMSKSFDRVWHEGLLYKHECCRVSSGLLSFIASFLTNREQRVVVNGKSSGWKTVSAAVTHGSVLGPLFFLLYVNDLPNNITSDVKLFADDTSLLSVVHHVNRTAA